ncbi:hypothetical protein [Gemmatimonas sp.]|uniref:hypothetical protein n=1 Tax=Gemmatimonas sp. TaxID=1962908 RepID=UPI00286DA931|nr:hypothetical protein [Gemmatimonas sp.]
MPSSSHPDRRAFLQGALCTVAGLTLVGGCSPDAPYDDATLMQPTLLPTLGPTRVREIGQAYRRATPAESTAPTLRAAIARGAQQLRGLRWSPYPSLEALITADFTDGRVVFPAGWMLSVNEARQCGLFSLQG